MSSIDKTKITKFEIIDKDLIILSEIITKRLNNYFSMLEEDVELIFTDVENFDDEYSSFIKKYQLSNKQRLIILLALAQDVSPQTLDPFLSKNTLYDIPFSEFGGIYNENVSVGFIPTIQTALFLLGGTKYSKLVQNLELFSDDSSLIKNHIIEKNIIQDRSLFKLRLSLNNKVLNIFVEGSGYQIDYSEEFPASLQKSNMQWDDLVFSKHTKDHLQELEVWLKYNNILQDEWGMRKSIKDGYKALFYGPPGTGKSLTATLLGKKINKPVYRIDLSQIVSKYIGETEKNLELVFNRATNEEWILFFDEADSLFGKRTQVNSSNDRYANQSTSYLLQRIDEFNGMIILASNFKENFDEAYLRRFQSIIYFPLPEKEERLKLWKKSFSSKAILDNVDLEYFASEYELSGASIMNVVRYASLMAIKDSRYDIYGDDILTAIKREKFKEGKII